MQLALWDFLNWSQTRGRLLITEVHSFYLFRFCRPIQNTNNQLTEEDDDVKRERQRVVNGTGSCTDAMRLVNLTKVSQHSSIKSQANNLMYKVMAFQMFSARFLIIFL